MKISCPSCSAIYNIPDEKLSDKEKKVQCKKCEEGIVTIPALKTEEVVEDMLGEPENEIIPEPELSETKTKIDDLDVSDSWKRRLKLMDDITPEKYLLLGKDQDPNSDEVLKEALKHFNWLAFFFGSFYYFYNKMWGKGFLFLILTFLLDTLVNIFSSPFPIESLSPRGQYVFLLIWISVSFVIPSLLTGRFANYDFYMLKVRNITMWEKFKSWFSTSINIGIAFTLVFTIWFFSGFLDFVDSDVPECNESSVINLVKEITNGEMAKQIKTNKSKASELFSYSVDDIKTTNVNEETGKRACSATLYIQENKTNESTPIPITYTVEGIEGSDQIYVNVFGL